MTSIIAYRDPKVFNSEWLRAKFLRDGLNWVSFTEPFYAPPRMEQEEGRLWRTPIVHDELPERVWNARFYHSRWSVHSVVPFYHSLWTFNLDELNEHFDPKP